MIPAFRNRLLCCWSIIVLVLMANMVAVAAPAADSTAAKHQLRLAGIFSDNMVLQRDMKVPVWGWAEPGREVTVSIGERQARAKVDKSGRWMVKLSSQPAGGPHELKVVSGDDHITLHNVLFGDVWICSGQSNMAMAVSRTIDAKKFIEASTNTQLRLYTVDRSSSPEPLDDVGKHVPWAEAGPANRGSFSAAAYYFGLDLQKQLGVPIGLIHTSWGGTPVQSWTSLEALRKIDSVRDVVREQDDLEKLDDTARKAELQRRVAAWQADIAMRDRGSEAQPETGWAKPKLDTSDWKTMSLPTYWETAGLPGVNGAVWFRKEIEVPASMAGKRAQLYLGTVDESDETYVNGKRLGPATGARQRRHYRLPADLLKAGTNLIAVRVLDTAGPGGFSGQPGDMRLEYLDKSGTQCIALAGEWKYRVGLQGIDRRPADHANSRRLGGLYNGMIAPLIPYAIKGAIWYQGEANANEAYAYRTLFPAMIRDWRSRWKQGDFPFLFVQLANFRPQLETPNESTWAELREAQLMTLSLKNTGMAVAIDIGEANDIHPKNKQDVGKRLALAARHIAYGEKDLVYSGPVYRKGSMKAEGNRIRLSFDDAGGGLVARGGELRGFTIAGRDHGFVKASARIDGDSVVVWSDSLKEPAAVRYGWADNPDCNLYNKDGLPATPFRTDNWPGITR